MGWFLVSVLANVLPRDSWIRRTRLAWVLPEWRFFAPTPATHDYEVFYRLRSDDGEPTNPTFVTFPARAWQQALFNPHSRTRKATRDAVEDLLNAAVTGRGKEGHEATAPAAADSDGYRAILREVRQLARYNSDLEHIQFGVLFVQGLQPPKIVFVSPWQVVG